jgi:PPOX class probable F420-dependent enzyme
MAEDVETGKLDEERLAALLDEPVIARMGTVSTGGRPHVVPVWFLWEAGTLWISSFRSTRKVRDLERNPNLSVLVDTAESGVDYQAALFEGPAELVVEPAEFVQEMSTRIYTRYLGPEGVLAPDPQSWIHDPENLLIRLKPEKIFSWYSAKKT